MPKIIVAGQELEAATCPHGCRVWPISSMAMHVAQHSAIRAEIESASWMNKNGVPKRKRNYDGRPRKKLSEQKDPMGINIPMRSPGART